jgi:hypothetical protein
MRTTLQSAYARSARERAPWASSGHAAQSCRGSIGRQNVSVPVTSIPPGRPPVRPSVCMYSAYARACPGRPPHARQVKRLLLQIATDSERQRQRGRQGHFWCMKHAHDLLGGHETPVFGARGPRLLLPAQDLANPSSCSCIPLLTSPYTLLLSSYYPLTTRSTSSVATLL